MDTFSDEFLALDAARDRAGNALERTSSRCHASIAFTLEWTSEQARHTDVYVASALNLWRDYFLPELEAMVQDKPVGHRETVVFKPGVLVPAAVAGDCLRVDTNRFNRGFRPGHVVEPRAGRFYPRGCIAGVKGLISEDMTPFRIGTVDAAGFIADLNAPLAERPLTLTAHILDAWQGRSEHGGRANDVADMIAGKGPGMQARWRNQPTDFFSDAPFARSNALPDEAFYQKPRLVDHLDRTALGQVQALYGRLIPKGAHVLDLMTSWKSHLEAAEPGQVTGLGMNAEELAANPLLAKRCVHDLNFEPRLPFADARFDAAVCTVSVEYLTQPIEVFREVARVLKPGAPFVLTFSNRYFPPKVVRVWEEAHPFERPGLVLEYFHRAGGFSGLNTFSLVGLPRPEDDKYAAQMAYSDPIHAVWGMRA